MIKLTASIYPPMVEQLNRSEFDFYLTGSRFFGCYRELSDYDFFTQKSPEIESFLLNLGFTKVTRHHYKDILITSVFRYYTDEEPCVDVQLLNSALPDSVKIKSLAQNILRLRYREEYLNSLHNPLNMNTLWNKTIKEAVVAIEMENN